MAATAGELRKWLARFHEDTPVTALTAHGKRHPITGWAQTDHDPVGVGRWRTVSILIGPPDRE
jgi:hypothetical protein